MHGLESASSVHLLVQGVVLGFLLPDSNGESDDFLAFAVFR